MNVFACDKPNCCKLPYGGRCEYKVGILNRHGDAVWDFANRSLNKLDLNDAELEIEDGDQAVENWMIESIISKTWDWSVWYEWQESQGYPQPET